MRVIGVLRHLLPVLALVVVAACAQTPAAPATTQPAKPAAPAAAPAQPAKPAAPAAAPAQPAKPAAPAAAPAAAPSKPAAAEPVKRIAFGTLDSTSGNYPYFVAATKVINDSVPGVNVTVVSTGGASENINRAQKGEFDFIVMTTQNAYQAVKGIGPWKDKPFPELRWLWIRSVQPVAVVVREDSGVKKLEDLNGKAFNAGQRGASAETQIKDMFEALGIAPKWFVANAADGLQAVKDGRIAGFAKAMADVDALDANIIELMGATKIRVLPMSDEQVKKVLQVHPYYSASAILPNVFKDTEWNKGPILSMSIATGGGATKLPEDVAYSIVKALDQDNQPGGKRVQAGALKGIEKYDFGKLTVESGLFTAPTLHPGAYRWYKERGLKIPEEIVPSEAKR